MEGYIILIAAGFAPFVGLAFALLLFKGNKQPLGRKVQIYCDCTKGARHVITEIRNGRAVPTCSQCSKRWR